MFKKSVSVFLALILFSTSTGMSAFAKYKQTAEAENEVQTLEVPGVSETFEPTETMKAKETVPPSFGDEEDEDTDDIITVFDASDLSQDLTDGSITISADGEYTIHDISSTANTITIASGTDAELTIKDITIASSGAAPITVETGARLTLHLEGTNTLTAPSYYAGIAVKANDITTDYGTLTIDGEGSLKTTGGMYCPGIGSNNGQNQINGRIIINGGELEINGGIGAPGMGAAYFSQRCGDIEINGGIIKANGGQYGAGIGGALSYSNGKITITGGYVKATRGSGPISFDIGPGYSAATDTKEDIIITGGSVDATMKFPPINYYGEELRQITITMPAADVETMKNTEVSVDDWTTTTDENAAVYPYITSDTTSYAVMYNDGTDDIIYYVDNITSDQTSYTFKKYTGDLCKCDPAEASIAINVPDTIEVNKIAEQKREKLSSVFSHASDCTYPLHSINATYTIETESGDTPSESIAKISDGYLVAYYNDTETKLVLKVSAEVNGQTYTDEKTVTIVGNNKSEFYISDGNIVLSPNPDSSKITVKIGTAEYAVAKDATIYIKQRTDETSNTITVNGIDADIALDNVNIVTNDINSSNYNASPIYITDGSSATVELIGENHIEAKMTSAVRGIAASSQMTIKGDGSLESISKNGPGIGNLKSLTIESGTIEAHGGNGGAGLGGANDASGMEVTINGGRVYAYGAGNGAGIGGGADTYQGVGGTFVMNGGFVYAESENNGCDIGYGGASRNGGTITINGGSVKTESEKFGTTMTKYKVEVSLENFSSQAYVSYYVNNGTEVKTSTDEDGKLYLYLPFARNTDTVLHVNDGENDYYRLFQIAQNNNNKIECVLDPTPRLTGFKVGGQIGDETITQDPPAVNVRVPYNISFSKLKPIPEYNGARVNPAEGYLLPVTEVNGVPTATYKVLGHDGTTKEYTVTFTKENDPGVPGPDVYDISKGNIYIEDGVVTYAGTSYEPNPQYGYIITGTTTENVFSIDTYETVPPIVFDDLHITSVTTAVPFTVYNSADITIKNNCSIDSVSTEAVHVYNDYHDDLGDITLKLSGDGKLDIQGGNAAVAIDRYNTVQINDVTTTIEGAMEHAGLSGIGDFITDSETYMYISGTDHATVQPKNSEGTALYQLAIKIQAEDKTETECKYNGKTYYTGTDATVYLMVPNDDYDVEVVYDEDKYVGSATVNSAQTELLAYTIAVKGIDYPDEEQLPYQGATVDFIVDGTRVAGNVAIRVEPDDPELYPIQRTVEDVDGVAKATITLPENTSYEKDVTYTVYYRYIIDGVEGEKIQVTDKNKLIVRRNTTICNITAFEMPGQIGETQIYESEDYNSITLDLPYDHVYKQRYTPSKIEYIGRGVDPAVDSPEIFTDAGQYFRHFYTVTARDNIHKKRYEVRMYRQTTPSVTRLSFVSPSTSEGGDVEITFIGTALDNIKNAENPNNRIIRVYSENGISETAAVFDSEKNAYVAKVHVDANASNIADALYPLKVKIGDTEQTGLNTALSTIRVPRRNRSITSITAFTIEGQTTPTEITDTTITLTMPYDTDMTSLLPGITLGDTSANFEPKLYVDFSNSETTPVVYTVTAEDGSTQDYAVTIHMEAEPMATSIDFENPDYSLAGPVEVLIHGTDLDNINRAINRSRTIVVSADLLSGDPEGSNISPVEATAVTDEHGNLTGDYIATLDVPPNNNGELDRTYKISVSIGDKDQTLTGNTTLTINKKERNSKYLTKIELFDNQISTQVSGNDIYVYVPYNEDLSNVDPDIEILGEDYTPKGPQNFNNVVIYRVFAQDDSYNDYRVHAMRKMPQIDSISANSPKTYADTDITVDIIGQFVTKDPVNDVLEITATARTTNAAPAPDATSAPIAGTVVADDLVYGGHATGYLTLPKNESGKDILYDIKITINGVDQPLGLSSVITVPFRKSQSITSFRVNGQTGDTEINEDDTIIFRMPYNNDLTALQPIVTYEGDSYTPTEPQNFDGKTLEEFKNKWIPYTVKAADSSERVYQVQAQRDGKPSISSVEITNLPPTYIGKTISLDIKGVFYYNMSVRAELYDREGNVTETIYGNVEDGDNWKWHEAKATIELPTNYTHENKVYTLIYDIDGFENITPPSNGATVTVPRRTTREIKDFRLRESQYGDTEYSEDEDVIELRVFYNTNLGNLYPMVTVDDGCTYKIKDEDGSKYLPEGATDFDNEEKTLTYVVEAPDDVDREYKVRITREGHPSISSLSFVSPQNFKAGSVQVNITQGIFFEKDQAQVFVLDESNNRINGDIINFKKGGGTSDDAGLTAIVNIPVNDGEDSGTEKRYRLQFVLDNQPVSYLGATEIIVPRRTTRILSDFKLPDTVQEGDTIIEDTDIYIDVPYTVDLTQPVEPEILEYDADRISPVGAVRFDQPVQYTLSSSGDENVVYTVHVTRIGHDPFISSITVPDLQAGDTEYEGNNIKLVLKSSAKLQEITPVVEFDGTDYSPRGAVNFVLSKTEPVVFTVVNKYGVEKTYNVTITKKGGGSGGAGGGGNPVKPAATATPAPEPSAVPTEAPVIIPTAKPAVTAEPQPKTVHEPYISGYEEDGELLFKPDNTITRAEVAKILSVLDRSFDENTEYDNVFSDVAYDAWYKNYVSFASEQGYISGYEDGLSRPENMITRAEFVSMLARFTDLTTESGESRFNDLEGFDWCSDAINTFADMGIVSGYEDGSFKPENKITRSEVVTMINRVTGRAMTEEILNSISNPFADVPASHWAYNDILLASREYTE